VGPAPFSAIDWGPALVTKRGECLYCGVVFTMETLLCRKGRNRRQRAMWLWVIAAEFATVADSRKGQVFCSSPLQSRCSSSLQRKRKLRQVTAVIFFPSNRATCCPANAQVQLSAISVLLRTHNVRRIPFLKMTPRATVRLRRRNNAFNHHIVPIRLHMPSVRM
jgi:hypothetical protein